MKYQEVTLNLIMSVSVVATTAFASVVLNYFIVGGSIVAIVWETANQLSIRQRNQVSVYYFFMAKIEFHGFQSLKRSHRKVMRILSLVEMKFPNML